MRAPDVVLRGRCEPADAKRCFHVPFDVPPGTRQIHVRYEYSDRIPADVLLTNGNTLDIGLFDERGIAAGSPGYRGWSGSDKLAFTVDAQWATPPYRAGPIGSGTWHVVLGAYKVWARGLDWTVEIWFDLGLPREERSPARSGAPRPPVLPHAAQAGWVRGDLHCHTLYSDGDAWPSEMLLAAGEAGLAFLGVTDHNSAAHHAEYGAGGDPFPVVVPGIEVTTYRGHWNAWGTDRWYEFREPTEDGVAAAIREAVAAGAFVSLNHPKPFGPPWEYTGVRGHHAIEVWNGPWERGNVESLRFWDEHLRRGERIVPLGGSDTHQLRAPHHARLGSPTTWVRAGDHVTPETVLAALRRGDVFLSCSPEGPQLYLDGARRCVRILGARGASLQLVSEAGIFHSAVIDGDDVERPVAVPRGARYVRAQATDANGSVLALSNAVW